MFKATYEKNKFGRYTWKVSLVKKDYEQEVGRSAEGINWASREGAKRGLKAFVANVFRDILHRL